MRCIAGSAGDVVLSNYDLVAYMLKGSIGPSTYFAASLVSKAWHTACRSDETLLRLVALYQGGLTRTVFRRLFLLSQNEVSALPHIIRRRPVTGDYFVYGEEAVRRVLDGDGFDQWKGRLSKAPIMRWQPPRLSWAMEERLHRKTVLSGGSR